MIERVIGGRAVELSGGRQLLPHGFRSRIDRILIDYEPGQIIGAEQCVAIGVGDRRAPRGDKHLVVSVSVRLKGTAHRAAGNDLARVAGGEKCSRIND